MSVVKKSAKASLYIFSIFVILLIVGAGFIYVNMGSIAKQLTEKVASEALGVPVTIGDMVITLEEKKVVVTNIKIANPPGYKKSHAITVDSVTVAGESFSKQLLTFARVAVDGTNVNVEVTGKGTNLGDLKKNVDAKKGSSKPKSSSSQNSDGAHGKDEQIKVIVKKFALTKAQLNPSVTLIDKDLAYVTVPDIHLTNIGKKENGVVAQEAVAQIMDAVLERFNESANGAGFLEGLSLEMLNEIGVSTAEVFQKNLKESYEKEVDGFKKGLDDIKGLFE